MARDLFAPTAGLDVTEPVAGADLFAGQKGKGPGAKGFGAGVAGVKSAAQGSLALGARVAGAPAAEAEALAASEQASQAAASDVMRVEDVSSPGEFVDFAKYAVATALPSIALTLGGGVAGRALGALMARRAATVATREMLKTAGMVGGAGAGSFMLGAGEIFPEAVKEGVENPAARAVGGGAVVAALDLLAPAYLAARTGLVGAGKAAVVPRKAGFGAVAKGAVSEGAKSAVIEGLTEAAQEGVSRFASGQDLGNDEALSAYLNSLVIGALAGKVVGTGVGAVTTAARPIEQPPPAPVLPRAPAPTPEVPLPRLLSDQGALPDIRDALVPPVVDALPAAPDAGEPRAPVPPGYQRQRAPIAEDADLNTLGILRAQKEVVIQQRTALADELSRPEAERRTKSAIVKDARAVDAQIATLDTQIGGLEQQVKNRVAILETPSEPLPKGTVKPDDQFGYESIVPRESGAFKQPELTGDTAPAELAVAQQKRGQGQLLSQREAKLVRDVERGRPAAPGVEPVAERTPRSREKQVSSERRYEVIEGVAVESIQRNAKTLAEGGGFRKGTMVKARDAIVSAAREAAKAPTIEAAEKAVFDAAIKALAGKVNQADAATFAQSVVDDIKRSPTFYSKGAVAIPTGGHYDAPPTSAKQVAKEALKIIPGLKSLELRSGRDYWYITGEFADGTPFVTEGIYSRRLTVGKLSSWLSDVRDRVEDARPIGDKSYEGRKFKLSSNASVALADRAVVAPSELLTHVSAVSRAHAATGGSSTQLTTGRDLGGTDNYSVSIYKERELKILGQPTQQQIREYITANADLLSRDDHVLGTWHNPKDGYTYLDVSIIVPNVVDAIALGREHQQLAVFYLGTYDTIPVGSADIHDLSHGYTSQAGLTPAVAIDYIPVPVDRMRALAQGYEWLRDNATGDARIANAYDQFITETDAQFNFISQHIKIEPWSQEGQPYANSAAMMQDVSQNRHLWVFEGGEPHPYMTPEQNWRFRAVHDIFGHVKTGFEFGPRGELNATRAHAQMYSEAGQPALVTETLGQNAWVNFSAQNEGKLPAERAYAKQKADILPRGLWEDLLAAPTQARQESLDQHSGIFAYKGEQLISRLKEMIGDDPNLQVQLFTAKEGEPIGGYTRLGPLQSVVSLALNAKEDLSIADHEGFHYLEDRVLDGRERIVLARAFRLGSETFKRLLARVRAYDLAHKTQLADEILSVPQEARAYGYEFWRRGELQAEGLLQQVFEKIRAFLERVVNAVNGLGFQSHEDILSAIALGQYAERGAASPVVETDTEWAADVEPDVVPGGVLRRKDQVSSKAKGRPYWVQAGPDVARLRTRLKKLALEGETGRQWHAKSAAAILEWAKGDVKLAAKLAALIANFSPLTPVGLDLKKAFTAFVQYEAKQDLAPGAPAEHVAGARRILYGIEKDGSPAELDEGGNVRPTGIKRINFFKNLMLGIDPVNYNPMVQGATIDMWMSHAFGYANDMMGSVTKSQYNYADAEVKRLAKELGWSVEETQAAIWIATKARGNSARSHIERHALRNGWYEQVVKKDVKTATDLLGEQPLESKRVVKDDKQRQFVSEWMRMSMINPISKEQLEKANYDYARAFEDIYAGKIDLSDRLEELPYAITKPAEQDQYNMPQQPTLFSKGRVDEKGEKLYGLSVTLAGEPRGRTVATHIRESDLPAKKAELAKQYAVDAIIRAVPMRDNAITRLVDTLYSRAAVADMNAQMQSGELEREQRMQVVADMLDRSNLPEPTMKQIFGPIAEATGGGLKRWWLANVATGNFISRFSQGYANVQKALLTYVQRKSTLIAEGSRVQLSEWHKAEDVDTFAVGEALLKRTEGGYTTGSPEYMQLIEPMTDQQRRMFDQANAMIAGRLQHEFAVDQKSMQALLPAEEYNAWFEARSTQVAKLIEEGYVPERRYGDYTVHIYLPEQSATGRPQRLTLFYEQFENEAAAKVQAGRYQEILTREAPDLKVETGYRYRVERDTSISIQQFLDTARRHGVQLTQAERERIVKALVAADSSKRNRLLRRKNVPGYARDITRVLHEFVVTTSNKIAYAEMSSTINDAADGRPVDARLEGGRPVVSADQTRNLWHTDGPQSGFYHNLSDQLVDYVLVPDHSGDWSQKLRGAAMMYFIGGSLAAGAVNAMSVPMATVPWLSQSTSYANALTTTLAAWSTTVKNQSDLRDIAKLKNRDYAIPAVDSVPGLREALITASEDGTTLDTEIHQIMGMTQGGLLAKSRKVQRAADAWMFPFRFAEQVNRITSFIAAYRVGQENKLTGRQLYSFAKGVVDNTQNQYNEVNRPSIARHDVWALLFMFKSFPLFMTEMAAIMYKENPKALVYFLLGLTVMTGVHGLPFAETIMDLIDTIAQRVFGSPFNSRRALRNVVKDASEAIVGADLSELVLRGAINDLTGMSVASRIGMGDFIPGTRLGTADNDYGRTLADILGAPASMLSDTAGGVGKLFKGEFTAALREGAPTAVRNLIKGAQQYDRGYGEDMQGRKLVDVTGPEAFWQSIGLSSANLNRAYEMDRIDRQTQAFYQDVRADFSKQLVKAVREGDAGKAQETMDAIQQWNAQYPNLPIGLDPALIRRQIALAGMPLNERTLRLLPRQLRGTSVALEGTE